MDNNEDCFEITKEITERIRYTCKHPNCEFIAYASDLADAHNREHIVKLFTLDNKNGLYICTAYCKNLDIYLKITEDEGYISDEKNWVGPGWYILYSFSEHCEGIRSDTFVCLERFTADFILLKIDLDNMFQDFINQLQLKEKE